MDASRQNRRSTRTRNQHQDMGDYRQQPEAMGDARKHNPAARTPRESDVESDADPCKPPGATHVDVIHSLVGLIGNGGRRNKSEIKHSQFDGKKWEAFRKQFEKAANMNKWTDEEKASRLCCSLTGPALAFLHNPGVTDWPYEKLMTQMDKRFGCATADLNQIVEASKFVMGPKEPVMRFADRINESFAKSTMEPQARNSFCWFAFMQGLGKHHKEMRTHVRKETKKKQDYQLALFHAEEYAREYSPIADEKAEVEAVDSNAALVAQLTEKLHAKEKSSRTPAKPAGAVPENADKRLAAMIRELTTTDGHESETSEASSEMDAKVDAVEARLDTTVSRVCQILLNQKPNNNIKLKTTKPIPRAGTTNAEKCLEALTDKLLALEQAVEEREKNRLLAIQKRIDKENNRKGGGGGKPRKQKYNGRKRRDDSRDDYDDRRRGGRRRDDSRGRSRGRSADRYRSRDNSYRRHDDYNRRPAPPAPAPQASVNANHA